MPSSMVKTFRRAGEPPEAARGTHCSQTSAPNCCTERARRISRKRLVVSPKLSMPFCGLILLALLASAAAQETHPQSDEDACRPDVFRLCSAQISPTRDAIVACLNQSVAQLSPACRAVIAPESIKPPARSRRKRP